MSSIHTQRAKRWETNPFVAEWLANAFEYCRNTPEGKQAFERWAIRKYGPVEGQAKILSCKVQPLKNYGTPTGNAHLWNSSGVELGACDDAMKLYHLFTSENNLCYPERTKPAPKRRRGESSVDWLSRRHEALLNGCKIPNIDWEMTRAIAISEFDKARDTIEVWRTRPEIFLEGIFRRGASTIPSPDILNKPEEYKTLHTMDDAFKTRTLNLALAHMAWSSAADLFEHLARMGLTTASAIERAYKKDTALLWRLVSCFAKVQFLGCNLVGKLSQVVSWSEHFRPYFKRWRTDQGFAKVEMNMEYINKNRFNESLFDEFIVRSMADFEGTGASFFHTLTMKLAEDPSQTNKFSAEAFEEIGDIATYQEFHTQVEDSPFGQELRKYALSLDSLGHTKPGFLPEVSFMDPSKYQGRPTFLKARWGDASRVVQAMGDTWQRVTWEISMWDSIPQLLGHRHPRHIPRAFDMMWYQADLLMWNAAKSLDRLGESGRVAKQFGLVNPHCPTRPTFTEFIFKSLEPSTRAIEPATTPAPAPSPYVEAIPTATPTESAVKSGHAFVTESSENRPKRKQKTKATAAYSATPNEEPDHIDEVKPDRSDNFPVALPTHYKLGKRLLKVFQRVLEDDGAESAENAPKKGQLRWGDFERAMRRIGFDVVQTAGSSVRFDPPAQTARPITFHRPHPDSILSPHMIKLVGARLRRTYGWTTASFAQGIEAE